MSICAYCGKDVHRPKDKRCKNIFCDQSCSAKYNNPKHAQRTLHNKCKKCNSPIISGLFYCKKCSPYAGLSNKSYKDVKGSRKYQKNSQIREHARKVYYGSQEPKQCIVCGYGKHFDVCHVKDISLFPSSAKVSEINDITNLIPLCKNHHWEFDNNSLDHCASTKIDLFVEARKHLDQDLHPEQNVRSVL